MKDIIIPANFNYIGAFLTMDCSFKCPYCINNHHSTRPRVTPMSGSDWVRGLNRLKITNGVPITFQGGEPTMHRDFYNIINSVNCRTDKDLMTNLNVEINEFVENVAPSIFKRDAPYASIRVSYHNGQSDLTRLMHDVYKLQTMGYDIGVWEVDHPDDPEGVRVRAHVANRMGIDWRIKEFLGPWKGKTYGTFKYDGAVCGLLLRSCVCRTSELLVGADGFCYRCHRDLYTSSNPIGHILDKTPVKLGKWKSCDRYGECNACDVKITTNRFQRYGHSSVEIKKIATPTSAGSV